MSAHQSEDQRLRSEWPELRSSAQMQWGGLTKDDLERVGGVRSRLVEVIEERYGVEPEQAEAQVAAWLSDLDLP